MATLRTLPEREALVQGAISYHVWNITHLFSFFFCIFLFVRETAAVERITNHPGCLCCHPCFSICGRAGALEAALKDGSGAFLYDVLGSEGGTLPTRWLAYRMSHAVEDHCSSCFAVSPFTGRKLFVFGSLPATHRFPSCLLPWPCVLSLVRH